MGTGYGAFQGAADSAFANLMLFQMSWTECLHGAGSLRETLADLSRLYAARVVHLHRTCAWLGRQRTIATVDHGASGGERPLTRAVGPGLLSSALTLARPATVWSLADLEPASRDALDERCRSWLADRGIRDVAAILLDRSGTEVDFLELYLPTPLRTDQRTSLELLARTTSVAWARREKGRIARLLSATPAIAERLGGEATPAPQALLSPLNPCGLTASEVRVCEMFLRGYSTAQIAEQSRISLSTLRTHLRHIYAKASVAGQMDLMRRLLSDQGGPAREQRAAVRPNAVRGSDR